MSDEQDLRSSWYLEGYVDSRKRTWRTVIHTLPVVIGRSPTADLQLVSRQISHRHAELYDQDGGIWIRDLESTNGTKVNFEPLSEPVRLRAGDILHFADLEFRLSSLRPSELGDGTETVPLRFGDLTRHLAETHRRFKRMLEGRSARCLFQPIIDLDDGRIIGHEALCRGDLEGFETSPVELFSIAETLDLEVELARVFRDLSLEAAARLAGTGTVFLNTHPRELRQLRSFLKALRQLRESAPDLHLAIEVHEAAVTDLNTIGELRNTLSELGILLAFDDFGSGQSRLAELAEVPPDYLKFDMGLVRNLHHATNRRQEILPRLVDMSRAMGSEPIAEGVETLEELDACRDVGFQLAQGYFLGFPSQPRDDD